MGYQGFQAVEASAAAGGAKNPAAVAASIGRKKYGKEKFQKAAAEGKKMKGVAPLKKAKKKKAKKTKKGAIAGMLAPKFAKPAFGGKRAPAFGSQPEEAL